MTRYTASSPAKFANARFKEAQKATLFVAKGVTGTVQKVANNAGKFLPKLKGVNTKK
jgi:hypothetical protein